MDLFREEFNRYKIRTATPDLSDVIDFTGDTRNDVTLVEPCETSDENIGLKPVNEWKIYHLQRHPGFYVIKDPFTPSFKTCLVHHCLADYPRRPNRTNLDAHGDASRPDNPYADFHKSGKQTLTKDLALMRLRWTTLGYHYNWNSKTYSSEDRSEFPRDLASLTRRLAQGAGFQELTPQAAIVNYYHLKDNLGGHTDNSELDHEAPLVSISLGCSAVFLLGGESKAIRPSALLLRSGDVCIMSGPSRLAFHGVPRILGPDFDTSRHSVLQACELHDSVKGDFSQRKAVQLEDGEEGVSGSQCTVQDSEACRDVCVPGGCCQMHSGDEGEAAPEAGSLIDLKMISHYLEVSRININVRQVLRQGETFPEESRDLAERPDCDTEPRSKKLCISDQV